MTAQRATKRERYGSMSNRSATVVGILSIFDLTGVLIYLLTRRVLAVRKPDQSAAESFRASARIISAAQHEAVGASSGEPTR
jgi:hypothetical protein